MKSRDCFIVAIPSTDQRAVIDSVQKLMYASLIMKRPLLSIPARATGLASVRQTVLDKLKEIFPDENEVYVFWLDSDILIRDFPEKLAEYCLEAERRGVSWTANYKGVTDGRSYNTVFPYSPTNEKLENFSDEQLKDRNPFDLRVGHSGLGLCYIKTPLNYEFWTKAHQLDDFSFFTDNKIELYYCPVKNSHQKTILLNEDGTF